MSDSIRIHKQIVDTEKMLSTASHKGISFVRRIGNKIDYVNIQNVPEQNFVYLHNPSKITNEQRRRLKESALARLTLINEAVAINEEP